MAQIPEGLLMALKIKEVGFEVWRDAIYYLSADDYWSASICIKLLREKQPQAYNKYGANKVRLKLRIEDRISDLGQGFEYVTFDSEDEAEYYFMLVSQKDAGNVLYFEIHPRLELMEGFVDIGTNTKQGSVALTPDFFVAYTDGRKEYIDVKGMSNEAGDLRRRMYNYLAAKWPSKPYFGIPLRWMSYSKKYGNADGWIEYDKLQQCRARARREKKTA